MPRGLNKVDHVGNAWPLPLWRRSKQYLQDPFTYLTSPAQLARAERVLEVVRSLLSDFSGLGWVQIVLEVAAAFLSEIGKEVPGSSQVGGLYWGPLLAWSWLRGFNFGTADWSNGCVVPLMDYPREWPKIADDAMDVMESFLRRCGRAPVPGA